MTYQRKARTLQIGIGSALMAGFLAILVILRHVPSEAYPGMPDDRRAYWTWIASINEDPEASVSSGLDLLSRYVHLDLLYMRLAEICEEQDAVDRCLEGFSTVEPSDPRILLYRDAALAVLSVKRDGTIAPARLQEIAASKHLDPYLARFILDEIAVPSEDELAGVLDSIWSQRLAHDSTHAGAAFGLGYLAVLRNDWDRAEPLLQKVLRHRPDDPEAYRELGRIYYGIGQTEAFERTLKQGIEVAASRYDIEKELILRGNLGLGLMQQGDLDGAGMLFEQALAQSRMLSDGETEGFNLYRLAGVRLKQFRFDETLALLDEAEVLYNRFAPRRTSEVLALRGMTLKALYRLSDAEAELQRALEVAEANNDVAVQIQATVALAQLRSRMGRYVSAIENGLQALQLAKRYRQADAEIAAQMALGGVERAQGHFEAARAHYENALTRAVQTNNVARQRELHARLGITALNIGDVGSAQTHFESMLQTVRDGENALALGQAYLGMGHSYARFENYEEAIRLYDLGLEAIGQSTTGQNFEESALRINLLLTKAWDLTYIGRYTEAEPVLREARALSKGIPSREYRAEVLYGHFHLRQEHYREALEHYRRAEELEKVYQNPSMHWQVLHAQAVANQYLGNLLEAERQYRGSISIIETLRGQLGSSGDRSLYVQDKVRVYKDLAALLTEQGRSAEAVEILERAKSRSLVDLLYTTQRERLYDSTNVADRAIEMSRRIQALEEVMLTDAYDLDREEEPVENATRESYLRRERVRADSLYQSAQVELLTNNRMYTFAPLESEAFKSMLGGEEALVIYSLADGETERENAQSLAYVVLRDSVITRTIPVDAHTAGQTIRYFRAMIGEDAGSLSDDWKPVSRRLYQELMEPVVSVLPQSVRHLHIIPEGVLHYLPFAALLGPSDRFLVNSYTLSVSPSASTLRLSKERNPRRWRSMLLLADPSGRLPGSRREVNEIAAQSPNRRLAITGRQATISNLEELASRYDILHFATHGSFDSHAPWLSHLEMYDSNLSVADIGRLKLDAYLVTLSACETALGGGRVSDIPNGDEWVGLNQAFLAAGTPTVMASLWPIDDSVSSILMVNFYDALGPEGKAKALADVQRRFIRDPQRAHPYFWAAFTIVGDPL